MCIRDSINTALTLTLPNFPDWPRSVSIILFAYRNLVHASTGFSPAFLTFGRNPLVPLALIDGTDPLDSIGPEPRSATTYAQKITEELIATYQTVRKLQAKSSDQNRISRNENRYEVEYTIGDSVLLWDPKSTVNTVDDKRLKPLPCLLYTSPSPRDLSTSRMPSSA